MSKEFKSLAEAGAYFVRAAVVHETVKKAAMTRAGKKVLARAKSKFGVYQPEVGEWPRWMFLTDTTMDLRVSAGFTPDEPLLAGKTLRSSVRMSTDHDRIVIGSEDPRMLWHELGTVRIPPRPVLGPALYELRNEVRTIIGVSIANHMMYGLVAPEDM